MRLTGIAFVVGATVCLGFAAGCTSTSQGQAEPRQASTPATSSSSESSPGSTSASDGNLPSDGAPKVPNPLDTTRFQQNPCQTLTEAQLQQLNVAAPGTQKEVPLGLACEWRNQVSGGNAYIQWADKSPDGLSAVYKANKAGKYRYFVELPAIEGFPAVAANVIDDRNSGGCLVDVGVSDEISFGAAVQLSRVNVGNKNPCDVAALVAGMAIQTMKAGG